MITLHTLESLIMQSRKYTISIHNKMSQYHALYRVEVYVEATKYTVYMSEWMHYKEASKVCNRLASLSEHDLERIIYKMRSKTLDKQE
jgi:repressor of nif and glnA expression